MTADGLVASYQDVVTENAALRQRNAHLEQQVTGFRQRIGELEAALKTPLEHLEAARRAGKRQAAPFSKGPPQEDPKRPGQKAGHPAARRDKPQQVDRVLEVKLAHAICLQCGGELIDRTIQVQYQVEIPPVQPVVTQFNV